MAVLTENDIRKLFNEKILMEKGEFYLENDMKLTPSARTYLADKNIIIRTDHLTEKPRYQYSTPYSERRREKEIEKEIIKDIINDVEQNVKKEIQNKPMQNNEIYETLFGITLHEKPEHMTHLRGNLLVFKDNNVIALRGAIDCLESEIIITQVLAKKEGANQLVEDLEEIIRFIRKLLRCEITGDSVDGFMLQGLDEQAIREQSYHPSKYFGINHFLPTYAKGEMVAYLNKLRTMTRKTELIAFKAFKTDNNKVERVDIIRAFNRLSSLFWIMMFKYMSGKYQD